MAIQTPKPFEPESEEEERDLGACSIVEAVQVIHECLEARDRDEIRRILKSVCALIDIECEFHDDADSDAG